jgi:hypothetical protein
MLRKPARDLLVRYAHQVDVMSIPHRYKAAGEPHSRMGDVLSRHCGLSVAPFISAGGRVHYVHR